MIETNYKMTNEEKALQTVIGNCSTYASTPDLVAIIREPHTDRVRVQVQNMYEYIDASVHMLSAVGDFFSTEKVNVLDGSRDSYGGCESCDYGSQYYFEMEVLP